METELPGRNIEAIPYTGLVEALTKIGIISAVSAESGGELTKEDLLGFMDQVGRISAEGLLFTGTTAQERADVQANLMAHMEVARVR